MTVREFMQWVNDAKRGQSVVYHSGNLQFDRADNGGPAFRQVNRLADFAYESYQRGHVELKQRRVSDGVCAYMATRL